MRWLWILVVFASGCWPYVRNPSPNYCKDAIDARNQCYVQHGDPEITYDDFGCDDMVAEDAEYFECMGNAFWEAVEADCGNEENFIVAHDVVDGECVAYLP